MKKILSIGMFALMFFAAPFAANAQSAMAEFEAAQGMFGNANGMEPPCPVGKQMIDERIAEAQKNAVEADMKSASPPSTTDDETAFYIDRSHDFETAQGMFAEYHGQETLIKDTEGEFEAAQGQFAGYHGQELTIKVTEAEFIAAQGAPAGT